MMSVVYIFWMYVVLFALVGWMRGWAKELLVSFSVLLALALNHVLRRYIPLAQNLPETDQSLFWVRTIILLVFWKTFSNLITYVVFVDEIFFFLTALTFFFLIRPLKPLGVLLAAVFLAMTGFIILNTLYEKPQQAIAGLVFLAIGCVMFAIFRRTRLNSMS